MSSPRTLGCSSRRLSPPHPLLRGLLSGCAFVRPSQETSDLLHVLTVSGVDAQLVRVRSVEGGPPPAGSLQWDSPSLTWLARRPAMQMLLMDCCRQKHPWSYRVRSDWLGTWWRIGRAWCLCPSAG